MDNSTGIRIAADRIASNAKALESLGRLCPHRDEFAALIEQIRGDIVDIQKLAGGWKPEMAQHNGKETGQ